MSKSILLVVYEFPPFPSIGGRRWAKFAKYLALQGITVHVIGAITPRRSKVNNNWINDINHSNIKTYYIKTKYPHFLLINGNSFFSRLIRKLATLLLELCGMGIVQDKALFWKNNLHAISSKLIKEFNIINVISTGPPHRSNYYVTLLKQIFPHLNIICDFRDSWLDGKVYGLNNVSERVLKVEERMERYTVENADYLLFTYEAMRDDFKRRYKHVEDKKFNLFTHNYDPDDYPTESVGPINSDKYRFIYGGTITTTAVVDAFIPFLKALAQIKRNNVNLYRKIEVVIYGHHSILTNAIKDLGLVDNVKLLNKVPEELFYIEVAKSNFLLSFLGNNWKDYLTTKNIALLPFHKPIVLVSKQGLVSDFIKNNKYGTVINPDYCLPDLLTLINNSNPLKKQTYNKDIVQYSYSKATDRLIQLLK